MHIPAQLPNIDNSLQRMQQNKLPRLPNGSAEELPASGSGNDSDEANDSQTNGCTPIPSPILRARAPIREFSPTFSKAENFRTEQGKLIAKLKAELKEEQTCVAIQFGAIKEATSCIEQLERQEEGLKAKLDARQKQIKRLEIALKEKNREHAQLTNELARLKKEKDAQSEQLTSIKMEMARIRERLKLAESERATETVPPTANEASAVRSNTSKTQNSDLQNLEVKAPRYSLPDELNVRQRIDRLKQVTKDQTRKLNEDLAHDRERPAGTLAEDSKGKNLHDKKQSQAGSTAIAGHSPSLPTKKHNIDPQDQQPPKPKAEINEADHDSDLKNLEVRALFHRLHDELDAQQLKLEWLQKARNDHMREVDESLVRDRERLASLKNKNPSSESRKDWERSICYVV